HSDTVNSDRGSDIDSLVASCCCLARFRCDRVPALIAASVASTGRRQKLAGVARRNRKIQRCDPCADASQWCNLPARRPCKRDEPRPPFVAAGSASAAGRRKYSRSKTPLVPSAPNSNAHSSAACQCLEGETPWSSAGVDSCV